MCYLEANISVSPFHTFKHNLNSNSPKKKQLPYTIYQLQASLLAYACTHLQVLKKCSDNIKWRGMEIVKNTLCIKITLAQVAGVGK